jgi:hypothetical protein
MAKTLAEEHRRAAEEVVRGIPASDPDLQRSHRIQRAVENDLAAGSALRAELDKLKNLLDSQSEEMEREVVAALALRAKRAYREATPYGPPDEQEG